MPTCLLCRAFAWFRDDAARAAREVRAPMMLLALVAMVVIAGGSRLLNLAPNMTAVAAVALIAGFVFSSRLLAVGAVIAAMLASDAVIGGYTPALMVVVYAALALPVFFRPLLGDRPVAGLGLVRVGATAVLASTLFFLITNFAVWALGTLAYPKTFSGLAQCYVNALPFYRMTMLGDVAFSVALFGGLGLVQRLAISRVAQPA